MVNIDYLQFRKNRVRQPIQYAWCAATTKNFLGTSANKISKKEIINLDIGSLCDDVTSKISESQEGTRCTLYLSSMLAYGTVRLFQQQSTFFMEDCEKLILDLAGGQEIASQKKKKKAKVQKTTEVLPEDDTSFTPKSIPKIDIVRTLSKKQEVDLNLLFELDFMTIPKSEHGFGFNPNESEMTDNQLADLYREMMGEDLVPVVPGSDNAPQDNNYFHMDDAPILPAPETAPNLTDKQLAPPDGPQPEQDAMQTPKRHHPTRSRKPEQGSSSESAATAYSPPKKRSRKSHVLEDVNVDPMAASTPTREASLPGEIPLDHESPVFDFKKTRRSRLNITLPLRKSLADKAKAVAMALSEPMITDPQPDDLQRNSPSPPQDAAMLDDAQVELPNVSLNATPPPAERTTGNTSTRVFPRTTASSTASGLTLDTLKSLEANPRQKYIRRGKKIFADRIKVIDVESRPANFMTVTYEEEKFTNVTKFESITSLFNNPATIKKRLYCPEYRNWAGTLWNHYHKICVATQREPRQKRKKNIQENREQHIENMEIVDEVRQPSLPKDVPMNDEPPTFEVPEQQRAEQLPVDNQVTTEAFVHAPSAGLQTESLKANVTSDVVHDAPREVEQPQIVDQVLEEPPLPEINDQVEAAMSPKKRFKSKDDREIQFETVSNVGLTIEQLFDVIQTLWNMLTRRDIERLGFVCVEFEKVVKPGYHNSMEAVRYLHYCFILENQEKLFLQQEVPYDNLYLIKW